eukprot:gene3011-3291_t
MSVVSTPQSLREIWLFRLHREAPSKAFLALKNSPAPRVTEAESNIRTFLEKRLEYKQRTQIWIQVSQGTQTPKILALEVTYHPAVNLASGMAFLTELTDKITALVGGPVLGGPQGMLQLLRPNWEDQHELKDGVFGPLHTVALYNDLLSEGLAAK